MVSLHRCTSPSHTHPFSEPIEFTHARYHAWKAANPHSVLHTIACPSTSSISGQQDALGLQSFWEANPPSQSGSFPKGILKKKEGVGNRNAESTIAAASSSSSSAVVPTPSARLQSSLQPPQRGVSAEDLAKVVKGVTPGK